MDFNKYVVVDGSHRSEVHNQFDEQAQKNLRDRLTRSRMRAQVAALYSEENTMSAISQAISEEYHLAEPLTVNEIKSMVEGQIRFWKNHSLKSIDEKMALVLARINQIEEMAIEGYYASMRGRTTHYHNKEIERLKPKGKNDKPVSVRNLTKVGQKLKEKEESKKPGDTLLDQIERAFDEVEESEAENLFTAERELEEDELKNILELTSEKIKQYRRFEENAKGDPTFLKIMLDCCKERAKIWNLYVRDMDAHNPDREYAMLTDSERETRFVALMKQVQERVVTTPTHLAAPAPMGGFLEADKPDEVRQLEAMWADTAPKEAPDSLELAEPGPIDVESREVENDE